MTIKRYEYRDSQTEFTAEQRMHGMKLADIIAQYWPADPAKAEAAAKAADYAQDSVGIWFYRPKNGQTIRVPVPQALQTDPLSKRFVSGSQPVASGTWEMPHGTGEI